jgi:ABC-2 type transport system permease protein
MSGSLQRIYGMVLRHVYLWRRSWVRVLDTAYWPTMNMVLWGFIAKFFAANSSVVAQVPALLISGLLLWEVLFRGQLAFRLSRGCIRATSPPVVSPLRPIELIASMIVVNFLRTCVASAPRWPWRSCCMRPRFRSGLALVALFANLLVTGGPSA